MNDKHPMEPKDPAWFLEIGRSYHRAFELVWKEGFESRRAETWDEGLLLYPVGFLLGHALEMALKGLALTLGKPHKNSHDLEELLSMVDETEVTSVLASALAEIRAPEWFARANPSVDEVEVAALFKRHDIHVALLNKNYGRPYSVRYPNQSGFVPFEPVALHAMTSALLKLIRQNLDSMESKP